MDWSAAAVMSVTVVIGTYGDLDDWGPLAYRAYRSVKHQTRPPEEIFWVHGPTLHQARNAGAEQATSRWLIFLDADDTLDPHYIEAMLAAEGDIRYPSTLGVVEGREDDYPVLAEPRNLKTGNFITIGAMVRWSDFMEVEGFDDYSCLEDWDLFLRIWLNGAEIQGVEDAIYRVTVRPGSRNEELDLKTYQKIERKYRGWARLNNSV